MKNNYRFIFTVLSYLVLTACNKSSPDITKQRAVDQLYTSNQLYLDSNFNSIIVQENHLKNILTDITSNRKISINQLVMELEGVKKLSKDSNELKLNLNKLGNPHLYEFLQLFTIKNQTNWLNIRRNYSSISSNDIKVACEKYFNQQYIMEINDINKLSSNTVNTNRHNLVSSCGWGYNLCIAGVTAGAILCHAECIGLTAGFGAPICVSLCGTMQIAAGAGCMNSYCNFNQ
jgi:hypothetical protein